MRKYGERASVLVGGYEVQVSNEPPELEHYERHAELVGDFDFDGDGGCYGFVAVTSPREEEWPSLVVRGRFDPGGGGGPGVVLVPETEQVFIGAGMRVVAFDRRSGRWQQTWSEEADFGFWSWTRARDVVLMAAELQFTAWTVWGEKLWSRFVEPPWSHTVLGDVVRLDVMGEVSTFPLLGPPA